MVGDGLNRLPFGRGRSEVDRAKPTPRVAILGAGVGGLCMAIQLARAGIETFTVYEKGDGVGGTWRDNTYPGAACDVPAHLYSYSFEPNPAWSHVFAEQPEILSYLERCADRYGIRPHLRCHTPITEAGWDEEAVVWRLRTAEGEEVEADVVVSALGQLNLPAYPDLPGLDGFYGTTFHSARWHHDHDLSGERVAVIGTGASAVQLVPRIQPLVDHLTVFQRSASWIVPRPDRSYSERAQALFRDVAGARRLYRSTIFGMLELRWFALREGGRAAARLERLCRRHLDDQVSDPRLREILTPDHPVGCKRVLVSSDYYPALAADNVSVVTSPIERVGADALVTADGRHHEVDTIVFATGFQATRFLAPVEVVGRAGTPLRDVWRDGADAYLGLSVPGFPNLFMLYGPNTNLGHSSIVFMIERQVRLVLELLAELQADGVGALEVRREAFDRHNRELQRRMHSMVWEAGCHSWYKTEAGKVTNNWPGTASGYWLETRRANLGDFHRLRTAGRVTAAASR